MGFPVEEGRISEAEQMLGRPLPDVLRRRLQRDNGGEIEADRAPWVLFPVWDPSSRKTMGRTANHVVRETELAREWPGFPVDAIAIASNGFGDLIIVRRGSDEFRVWDHETGETVEIEIVW